MKRQRRPQQRCKCGHAKTKHRKYSGFISSPIGTFDTMCNYCWDKCSEFKLDPLATIERFYEWKKEKNT